MEIEKVHTTTYIGEFNQQIKSLHGFSRPLSFTSQLNSLGQGGHFAANQKGGSSIKDLKIVVAIQRIFNITYGKYLITRLTYKCICNMPLFPG